MSTPAESTPSPLSRWLAPALCTLAGLAWAAHLIGVSPLLPGSVEWMLQEDWAQPLLGWLYSRTSPWSLPLGDARGYLHPLGTSLAYTDATPWWSAFFKLLSPLLPAAFQIHGPWLALCFALQGLFGALLVARFSPRPLHQLLGGLLFVLSPALAMRLGHLSLCAHWLVLAALWLHLRPCPDARAARRSLGLAAFFVVLAAGVHVYLAVMTLTLALALVLRVWRVQGFLTGARPWLWAAGLIGAALGVLVLFGYFSRATTSAGGFGHYSSNVLTFLNPDGFSRFVPSFRQGAGQYEGFGYLGLGVLLVGLPVLGVFVAKRKELGPLVTPALWPLLGACLLLAVFAWSSRIQVAGWTVLSFQRLAEVVLAPLLKVFRSSGRFIWPLHYLFILGAIAGLLRLLKQRPAWATAVLALAVVLQVSEVSAEDCCRSRFVARVQPAPGGDETWALAAGTYQHLALHPALRVDGAGRGCASSFSNAEVLPYAWQAWQRGMTFNSGYVARLDEPSTLATCQREEADIQAGRLAADTIYVVHAQAASRFLELTAGQASCGTLDEVLVCVSTESRGPFREALARHPVTPDVARDTP
ncbi:MAG TPA: DUF6311 domain-containing protein [Archangium sp.]|uniref:DUF6311 domain-containing protein n=1 Tax=Archangium sp. TaxID=1872627 RepID=UPI002ED8B450